jgi:hypothetical protein
MKQDTFIALTARHGVGYFVKSRGGGDREAVVVFGEDGFEDALKDACNMQGFDYETVLELVQFEIEQQELKRFD